VAAPGTDERRVPTSDASSATRLGISREYEPIHAGAPLVQLLIDAVADTCVCVCVCACRNASFLICAAIDAMDWVIELRYVVGRWRR